MKAVGDTLAPFYGPHIRISDPEAMKIAEPAGRLMTRYNGMTERVQELSDPILLAGAIASVAFPRVMAIMAGRAAAAAPPSPYVPPPAPTRETTVSQTVREPIDAAAMNETIWRMRTTA